MLPSLLQSAAKDGQRCAQELANLVLAEWSVRQRCWQSLHDVGVAHA